MKDSLTIMLSELPSNHAYRGVADEMMSFIKSAGLEGVSGDHAEVDANSLANILNKRVAHFNRIKSRHNGIVQIVQDLKRIQGKVFIEQHVVADKILAIVTKQEGLVGCFIVTHNK